MTTTNFEERLKQCAGEFTPVVPFAPEADKLLLMDFTSANNELTDEVVKDTNRFIQYINQKLKEAGAKYGIGGYGENRTIYRRSAVFGPFGPLNPPVGDFPPHNAPLFNDPVLLAESLTGEGRVWVTPPAEEPEGAAPSGRERERQRDTRNKQEKTGFEHADPFLYGMLKEYALQNRSTPTRAEEILWTALKTKKIGAYKFRRQHILDKFIADFVCLKKRLVIEVDGLVHQLPENKESDAHRTDILNELGFTVIRFTNDEVLFQLEIVTTKILAALEQSTVSLQPMPSEKTEAKEESLTSVGCAADGLPGGKVGMGRSLHLGIDIWGAPYTKVMAPLNGIVHSFAFNNAYGDYGATVILTHNLDGESFHTLYGHLSLNSLKNLHEGDVVKKGDVFAEFGIPFENGQWPPHLHFQLIKDMQGMKGDYPGVCAVGERESYLANCPDADWVLGMMKYADKS